MYQINIFEYMKNRDKPREINCKGLCDDPYCPKCDYEFDYFTEVDAERCPKCGCRVNWDFWHRLNDEDNRMAHEAAEREKNEKY